MIHILSFLHNRSQNRYEIKIIIMKQIHNFLLINCLGLLISCNTNPSTETNNSQVSQDSLPQNQASETATTASVTPSATEAFDIIPEGMYRDLNAKLAASTKKISAKEVVKMYYPAEISKKTSFEKIKVETQERGGKTIVTLTHDNQSEHILIQGHRIVMTLEQKEAHWQIVSLQQQYKCWIRKEGALWSNDKCS